MATSQKEVTTEETIFKYAGVVPKQLLSAQPEKNSIQARRFLFSLENLISQLNSRFSPTLIRYFTATSYKYSAPHRHQIFWRHFRQLKSLVCKYNDTSLLKVLNDLQKKMSSAIAQSYYYMPTAETLCYIGASYVHQIYLLKKIRDSCIHTADTILGYLDIGHWQNLGLFILGLCGEVFQAIPSQVTSISTAYDSISEFLNIQNTKFPKGASSFPLAITLQKMEVMVTANPRRVLKLLKFTEGKMEEAILKNELSKSRIQARKEASFLETSIDLGIEIDRAE